MKRGDIVQLGPHRLMCGDCTDSNDVSQLFDGKSADVIFTSPPYLNQRTYNKKQPHTWDALMRGMCSSLRTALRCQAFINLGLVYHKHEWIEYWHNWAHWMSSQGWLRLGWYVWDKMDGLPALPMHGRLSACHEFVFHFARTPVAAQKTIKCKHAGKTVSNVATRQTNGLFIRRPKAQGITVQSHRIADTVTRVSNRGARVEGHVASFPLGLPQSYIESFSQPKFLIYDPFSGAGTSILACVNTGRVGYGMEIDESYCDLTVARYRKHLEKNNLSAKPKRKVVTA